MDRYNDNSYLLDEDCVSVVFKISATPANTKEIVPAQVVALQLLDKETDKPILGENDSSKLFDRISFTLVDQYWDDPFLAPTLNQIFRGLSLEKYNEAISIAPWKVGCSNPLFALVVTAYSVWSRYIPGLRKVSRAKFLCSFAFHELVPNNLILRPFNFVTEKPIIKLRSHGAIKRISYGRKDMIDFGVLHVSKDIWRSFGSQLLYGAPEVNPKARWNIRVFGPDCFNADHASLKVVLYCQLDTELVAPKYVGLWKDDDIFQAICYLFTLVDKNVKTSPLDHINLGPSLFSINMADPAVPPITWSIPLDLKLD